MSRPKKATVEYFPHFTKHGKTMFTIEAQFGNDGYAFWFKMLEFLGETEHHYLDCNKPEVWGFLLAKTRVNEITANNILNLFSRLGAIDSELWQKKVIRSENFVQGLEPVYKRRNVEVHSEKDVKYLFLHKSNKIKNVSVNKKPTQIYNNPADDNIYPQSKVKYSKGKESEVNTHSPTPIFLEGGLEKNHSADSCISLLKDGRGSDQEVGRVTKFEEAWIRALFLEYGEQLHPAITEVLERGWHGTKEQIIQALKGKLPKNGKSNQNGKQSSYEKRLSFDEQQSAKDTAEFVAKLGEIKTNP